MPKHSKTHSDGDGIRRKKHKKDKHAINKDDEETKTLKKSKHRTSGSPDQSPRHPSKHSSRQSAAYRSRSRSPVRHRPKKVKTERIDDDYRSYSSHRPRQSDVRIKREEDFDRRQEELRSMRRGEMWTTKSFFFLSVVFF